MSLPLGPGWAALSLAALLAGGPALSASAQPIAGGERSREAYRGWLAIWRQNYQDAADLRPALPKLEDEELPAALRNVEPLVIVSSGGVAGGVVSEGMGYGLMVEGFEAAAGSLEGLHNGLRLARAWLELTQAPRGAPELPVWKYPERLCTGKLCHGTATDGDEDAALGLIYLAAALGYPYDFVDWAMRTVISFAIHDLGFPNLYRTLQDGSRVFVPRGGSLWGGLTPKVGPNKTDMKPWCYSPSYFAPGHYRLFREFVREHWTTKFDGYLPMTTYGTHPTLDDLVAAFLGAVTAGYNLLYRASCESGAVANWVGSKWECKDAEALSCPGVPWADTPYIGADGTCHASGTDFGAYGADASRVPWRIAMDYVLFTEDSAQVPMYGRDGERDYSIRFSAQVYLNRFVGQYREYAKCNATEVDDCWFNTTLANGTRRVSADKLAIAFEPTTPRVTCRNVPNQGEKWWAAFMAYPTFTAFVAPAEGLDEAQSVAWMELFSSICSWQAGIPEGSLCSSSYFELGQEVISTMIISGALIKLDHVVPNPARPPLPRPPPPRPPHEPEEPPSQADAAEVVDTPQRGKSHPAAEEAHKAKQRSPPGCLAWMPQWILSMLGFSKGATAPPARKEQAQARAALQLHGVPMSSALRTELEPSQESTWQQVLARMCLNLGPVFGFTGLVIAAYVALRPRSTPRPAKARQTVPAVAGSDVEASEPLWVSPKRWRSPRDLERLQ